MPKALTPKPDPQLVVRLDLIATSERSAAWDELWRRLLTVAMQAVEAEDAEGAK